MPGSSTFLCLSDLSINSPFFVSILGTPGRSCPGQAPKPEHIWPSPGLEPGWDVPPGNCVGGDGNHLVLSPIKAPSELQKSQKHAFFVATGQAALYTRPAPQPQWSWPEPSLPYGPRTTQYSNCSEREWKAPRAIPLSSLSRTIASRNRELNPTHYIWAEINAAANLCLIRHPQGHVRDHDEGGRCARGQAKDQQAWVFGSG